MVLVLVVLLVLLLQLPLLLLVQCELLLLVELVQLLRAVAQRLRLLARVQRVVRRSRHPNPRPHRRVQALRGLAQAVPRVGRQLRLAPIAASSSA